MNSNCDIRRKTWEERKVLLLTMKFPEKLWSIVNEGDSNSIRWGSNGDTLLLEYPKFQDEILNRDAGIFKTKNIASFVRQLNLYGFRKVNRYNENIHEFKHPLFVRDRTDLLDLIKRKSGIVFSKHAAVPSQKVSKVRNFTPIKRYKASEDIENQSDEANPNTEKEIQSFPLKTLQGRNINPGPNVMPSVKDIWWNNFSPTSVTPYPSHPYYNNDIASQGWIPADADFYKSQNRNKGSPLKTDVKRDHTYYENTSMHENYSTTSRGNRNMYFVVMPGYAPPHNPNMYHSPGFYNGILPVPGMPLPWVPDNKNNEVHRSGFYNEEYSRNFNAFSG
ncbi:heat shock transcription factor, Y-linked-like [Stegodyphus dumicola]|uniref:heat shock transcription factor, Y-linked-like n=1 Tax=Stegodyphus dumicola TaxID=202533 RepID=UPI0015A8A92A|nr:heat shock transcription factor, Y-linked-like [Stegodyphus dumicola]